MFSYKSDLTKLSEEFFNKLLDGQWDTNTSIDELVEKSQADRWISGESSYDEIADGVMTTAYVTNALIKYLSENYYVIRKEDISQVRASREQ